MTSDVININDQFLTWIDRQFVDSSVPLGEDEVELSVLAERTPFCVDDHVFLKEKIENICKVFQIVFGI